VVNVKSVIVGAKGEQVPSIAGLRECWQRKPPGRGLRTDEIAFLFLSRLRYVFILPGYYGYTVGFGNYRGYG
jgi:hypothetical protein